MDERTPIQVGIDLRPIPLQVGENVYHFNPDPGGEFFATVARIDTKPDDSTDWTFVEELRKVLASQIVDPAEKKAFLASRLGVGSLNAMSKVYAKTVFADPT